MKKYTIDIQFSAWYSDIVTASSKEEAMEIIMKDFEKIDFGETYNPAMENVFIDEV